MNIDIRYRNEAAFHMDFKCEAFLSFASFYCCAGTILENHTRFNFKGHRQIPRERVILTCSNSPRPSQVCVRRQTLVGVAANSHKSCPRYQGTWEHEDSWTSGFYTFQCLSTYNCNSMFARCIIIIHILRNKFALVAATGTKITMQILFSWGRNFLEGFWLERPVTFSCFTRTWK